MASAILIKDNEIAFSRLLSSNLGEVAVEMPDDGNYTPYGFLAGITESVNYIHEYLEKGPQEFYVPYGFYKDEIITTENASNGVLITAQNCVYRLRLVYPNPRSNEYPILHALPIRIGNGAKWVLAENVAEHEKAMMSMRLKPTLDEALKLYTSHSQNLQHVYDILDIGDITRDLQEMGYDLPLPKPIFKSLAKAFEEKIAISEQE